jgi:GAF domain-containing protein
VAGWVAEHRQPTIVEDPRHDSRFFQEVDSALNFRTHSLLAAPIIGQGRLLGVIEVLNKDLGRSFSSDDLTLLTLLCRYAGELLHSLERQARDQGD